MSILSVSTDQAEAQELEPIRGHVVSDIRPAQRAHTFAISLFLLCFALPLYLSDARLVAPRGSNYSMPVQWLIVVWLGFRLSELIRNGQPRPIATMFYLFGYVWMGLAGMAQIADAAAPWAISVGSASTKAQFIVILGVLALEIGAASARRSQTSRQPRHVDNTQSTRLTRSSIVLAPIWVLYFGGLASFFVSRGAYLHAVLGDNPTSLAQGGIIFALSTVPPLIALLVTLAVRRTKQTTRRERVVVVTLIAINLILNSPIAMPRFWTGTALTALIFGGLWCRRPNNYRIIVVGALFAAMLLFPFAAYFRGAGTISVKVTDFRSTMVKLGDYDSFELTGAAVKYADTYGVIPKQVTGSLLFFVPRSIWPEKPHDSGVLIGQTSGLSFTNLSCPLWGEAYLNLGLGGVAAVFFMYGRLMAKADAAFLRTTSTFVRVSVPLIAGYSVIILRGSLLQATGRLWVILGVLWLLSRKPVKIRWSSRPAKPKAAPADAGV